MPGHRIRLTLACVASMVAGTQRASAQAQPLPASAAGQYVGTYDVSDGTNTMPLRVFISDGALMGQLRSNAPTRLRFLGEHRFQPEEAPEFTVRFTVTGATAVSVMIEGGGTKMSGMRVSSTSNAPPDPATTGPLFDALRVADSLLFTASFATCDYRAAADFLAPDVEFYHDKTGFRAGDSVRTDFRRLTTNCPAKQGVRREVVAGSLRVYPIKDFGAVQMGEQVFLEKGNATATAARFVHLWRNRGGRWVLSRVMSFDHLPTPAPAR
jgi:hypothetical protein